MFRVVLWCLSTVVVVASACSSDGNTAAEPGATAELDGAPLELQLISGYAEWIDPENGFVVEAGPEELRVLQTVGAWGDDGAGVDPTTSEGLAYGLLLAVVHDDQPSFDRFANFLFRVTEEHGCAENESDAGPCTTASFLMPWTVDTAGNPYVKDDVLTNGSATDADLQIAWAFAEAAEQWEAPSEVYTGSDPYDVVFARLAESIDRWLVRTDVDRPYYKPGNQWDGTFYPGYFTPQAFELLDRGDSTVDWRAVVDGSLDIITDYQAEDSAGGLIPDTGDPATVDPQRSVYAFDASRFPLWVGAEALSDGVSADLAAALALLVERLDDIVTEPTLSRDGYAYPSGEALGATAGGAGPSLNGPAAVGACAVDSESELCRQLVVALESYDILENRPAPGDGTTPYFDAAMLLLSEAALEGAL